MNKRFFIYILFVLVVLSAAFGAVSASSNITEPALSSVGSSYSSGDDALSVSYEVNIEDNNEVLSLSYEESIDDNETLSLSNIEDNEFLGYWETVTTKAKGADYVPMSNGFTAFCTDREGTFPTSNTPYYTVHVNTLTHDYRTSERVDNKLRLAVIYYADNPEFQQKVRISRVALGSFSYFQHLVWYLCRYDESPYYMSDLDKYPLLKNAYYDIINRHNNGEWINEEKMTYNDGTYETTYEFLAFNSLSTYQKLFGYKKTVKEIPQIPKVPGMDVNKISLTPNVKAGEQTKFQITVRNTGDVDLNNVFVKENMPADLEYADYTNNNLWTKSGDFFYYNNVLKVGETASFTIIFNTNKTGSFTNCVVAGSDKTENKTTENTTKVYKPGMEVTKKSLTPNVLVGEQTLFLITVTNTGEVALGNVFVNEEMPEGLIYDSFTGDMWSKNGNVFNYNGVLAPGQSAIFTIVCNTTVSGKFINCVVAGSNETENKKSNNTTNVYKPGMDVTKKSLTPNVLVGEQTLFLITVTNTGDVALGNVFVEEDMPNGLIYDSFTGDKWNKNGNVFNYNGVLAVGQSVSFTIAFNTSVEGKFINCVVAGSDKTENKTTENTTNVVEPKVDVQKITITPLVLVGDQAEFEIIVTNTGKVALHNVILEETSYEGLIYDSFTDNGLWTHSVVNGKNVWTLNKVLNVNENVNLFVKFNTVTVGNFTNIVTVSSDETKDKTAKNTTIVYNNTEPVPEQDPSKNPDINIEKIALHKLLVIGSQAVFEIIVTNTGDAVLHDVCVSEDSFNGLVYDSWYDNTGLWTKNSDLTWTMNSPLYLGEIASFYVVFNTTKTGEFTNIVSVDSNETDKKSANDTVEVIKPDFAVEKIAINRSVLVGEQAMFEIIVQNLGQVDLNNVVVREDSFDGLVYDSFLDYTGLWTKNSDLSWSLNVPLAVGEYAGFFVVFNTTKTGNFVNVVVADSTEIPNKRANDTVEVLNADLEVQKITINKTVYVGEKVMFEIVVHNAGKVILNGVTIHENSFDGLVYDSFIDQYNLWTKNSDLSWTLNTPLYAGEYLSLFVVFNTNKVGTFTNVVSASSDKTQEKSANNVTTVIDKPVPEEPTPVVPEEPTPVEEKPTNVTNEAPVKNNNTSVPESPQKGSSDVLPATGNPLVMVLLALLAVGIGVLRRRD